MKAAVGTAWAVLFYLEKRVLLAEIEERFLSAQADAFAGSEREIRKRRLASLGMTGVGWHDLVGRHHIGVAATSS